MTHSLYLPVTGVFWLKETAQAAVEKIVNELLADNPRKIELVEVEYVKERDWYLRVFIDKPGVIGLEDCEELSGRLEQILDERDIIPGAYILEVSSPGLDRVLKTERDFKREVGKAVDVKLFSPLNGEKQFTGELAAYGDDHITLLQKKGRLTIPLAQIAQVRLHIDF